MEPSLQQNNVHNVLTRIKLHSIEAIIENAHRIVYHDVKFAKRLIENIITVSEKQLAQEDELLMRISAWLYTCLIGKVGSPGSSRKEMLSLYEEYIDSNYPVLLLNNGLDSDKAAIVIENIKGGLNISEPKTKESGIFMDAIMMDFIHENALTHLKRFYEEALLSDVNLSLSRFYEIMSIYIGHYKAYTDYGKEHIQPALIRLQQKLEKERRKFSKKKNFLIRKQLEISDEELRRLRKNLVSVRGRDVRGIQTLFRTTSRNHYTLNEMVDRKANIMITVNAIILSVVIGGLLGRAATDSIFAILPIVVLSLASLCSIIFAVLSITPNRTQGEFTADDIRKKEGNLLYFGNFHKMEFRDYEWGMLEKLNDSNFLYSSMIKDLYYLGKTLHRKYTFIRISLQFFLIGLISSFLIFMTGRLLFLF